jgi:hypothetical protein
VIFRFVTALVCGLAEQLADLASPETGRHPEVVEHFDGRVRALRPHRVGTPVADRLVALDAGNRQLKVFAGGPGSTSQFIIDITGYYAPTQHPNMGN